MRHSLYLASVLCGLSAHGRAVDGGSPPLPTPAPRIDIRQLSGGILPRDIDPISLAQALITGVPESLRQIAATNLPQASSILWSEFLDGKRPGWFTALPTDIQTYLVSEFGPSTVAPTSGTSTPATSSSAPTTSAPTTRSTSASTASSPLSETAPLTSSARVAASTGPAVSESQSGLSTAEKVGIGLGVPLALLAIAAIILACCLWRRQRRRRIEEHYTEHEHLDSRPPTPAFLASTMAPKPTAPGPTLRGGSGGQLFSDSDETPFVDPPAAAAGAVRNGRGSRGSFSSLTMVPEEESRKHEYRGLGAVPARHHRRSRGASTDWKNQYTAASVPVDAPDDWQSQHPALRNRDSGGPYPDFGADDPQHDRPGLRNSGSFSTPQGVYNTNHNSITRKPVPMPNDAAENFGNYSTVTTGHPPTRDALPPSQNRVSSQPRRSDWPFERMTNNNGYSNNGYSNNNSNSNNYWKVQLPRYDRYERVTDDRW